jgi:alpha-glucoside transport system permease protein
MGGLLSAFVTVILGLGGLIAVLLGLYGLTRFLPGSWKERGRITIFLFPALFVILIGLLIPALSTIYASMLSDSKHPSFVWFRQYKEIFSSSDSRLTLFNSLTWVVVGTAATTVAALAIARFADGMRGEKAAKSLIFIPGAVSLAGAGIIWRFVYAGPPFKVGFLNQVTKSLPGLSSGLGGNGDRLWLLERGFGAYQPSLSRPGFNTFLLIVVFIWASAGFATVVFSAAIKGVPETLIEAAKVDGATNRQVFYQVTLPYIRATIVTVATTITIGALKAFDIVASTTGGNFGTSTIANDFYRIYFVQDRNGLGSAFAVLLFVLVVPVVVINRRTQRRAQELMG